MTNRPELRFQSLLILSVLLVFSSVQDKQSESNSELTMTDCLLYMKHENALLILFVQIFIHPPSPFISRCNPVYTGGVCIHHNGGINPDLLLLCAGWKRRRQPSCWRWHVQLTWRQLLLLDNNGRLPWMTYRGRTQNLTYGGVLFECSMLAVQLWKIFFCMRLWAMYDLFSGPEGFTQKQLKLWVGALVWCMIDCVDVS